MILHSIHSTSGTLYCYEKERRSLSQRDALHSDLPRTTLLFHFGYYSLLVVRFISTISLISSSCMVLWHLTNSIIMHHRSLWLYSTLSIYGVANLIISLTITLLFNSSSTWCFVFYAFFDTVSYREVWNSVDWLWLYYIHTLLLLLLLLLLDPTATTAAITTPISIQKYRDKKKYYKSTYSNTNSFVNPSLLNLFI